MLTHFQSKLIRIRVMAVSATIKKLEIKAKNYLNRWTLKISKYLDKSELQFIKDN
jgi:RNase P/RNase MRP subunit POP5